MQKILDLREFEQHQAEAELGKANAELAKIQNSLKELAAQKISAIRECDGLTSDFYAKTQSQFYINFLNQKQEELLQELAQAQLIVDEKRKIVGEAMKKVKVLEKLKETKFKKWKKEIEKEEELAAEDISASMFSYKN